MKISIAVPCHVNDAEYLRQCLASIEKLNPPAYCHYVAWNTGETTLKDLRIDMFDRLFSQCDVVLSCDADFYLFPHILKYVKPNKVTSFAQMENKFWSDIQQTLIRLINPHSWSGLYSIPKTVWSNVKEYFDGSDTSIKNHASYVFIRHFCYYALRPTNTFRLHERIRRKLTDALVTSQNQKFD